MDENLKVDFRKVGAKRNNHYNRTPFYKYTYEMLEMFGALKGKRLLSYTVARREIIATDADYYDNLFRFDDDFLFYVYRHSSGFPGYSSHIQEISSYYWKGERGDRKLEQEDSVSVNEIVEDVILELMSHYINSRKEVCNVIFKLRNKYFVPNLHINYGSIFGRDEKREKVYYSTLEEYQNEEIEEMQDLLGEKDGSALDRKKAKYKTEFVTLDSYLQSHPVEKIKARIARFIRQILSIQTDYLIR